VVSAHPLDGERDWSAGLAGITFVEKPVSLLRLVAMLHEKLQTEPKARDGDA